MDLEFWEGTPITQTSGALLTHTYNSAGKFTVTLQVETAGGCRSLVVSKDVIIHPNPISNFTFQEACTPAGLVQFTNTSTSNDPAQSALTYLWNFGDNKSATAKDTAHLYTSGGTFKVSLQSTSLQGCVATLAKDVALFGSPVAGFAVLNEKNLCSNAKVEIRDTSAAVFGSITRLEIVWDGSNTGAIVPVSNPTKNALYSFTYPASTVTKTYRVILRAYTAANCFTEVSKTITVGAQPQVSFVANPSVACLGTNFTFTNTSLTAPGTGWAWTFGDATTDTAFNAAHRYTSAKVYTVGLTGTSAQGCKSQLAAQQVEVQAYPLVDAGNDLIVLTGGSVSLNPKITGSSLSYIWSPAMYLNSTTVLNPTSTPLQEVTYKLTAFTTAGCSASDEVMVRVVKEPVIPNAFSPNNDGINDLWNIEHLATYPNATIEIFNRYGQAVYRSKGYSKAWDGNVNGSPLPVGVYYYIIDPKLGSKKFSGSVTILR